MLKSMVAIAALMVFATGAQAQTALVTNGTGVVGGSVAGGAAARSTNIQGSALDGAGNSTTRSVAGSVGTVHGSVVVGNGGMQAIAGHSQLADSLVSNFGGTVGNAAQLGNGDAGSHSVGNMGVIGSFSSTINGIQP